MADLFETPPPPTGLLAEFDWAFDSWLTSKQATGIKTTAASLDLYRAMWQIFCRWCVGQEPPIRLSAVTRADVHQFATKPSSHNESEALSPRYVWRLLDLIEKVLALSPTAV